MRPSARILLAVAAASALSSMSTSVWAYDNFVDLNTYTRSRETSAGISNPVTATSAFAGADGVWLIEGNSGGIASSSTTGFTLTDWRSMIGNIAGPGALVSTEDNPPTQNSDGTYTYTNNPSYTSTTQIVGLASGYGTGTTGYTYLDAMNYHETGSTVGGTLLSSTDITGEAASHGGATAVLTRGYISGWVTPTNNDLANSQVTAAVMETNTLSENITGFVQASYLTGKRTYVYISSQYEDGRVIPWIFDLKQQDPAAMASSNTSIILTNGYDTTDSTNAYSWYGGDGTVQDSLATSILLKTAVPVNTFVWGSTTSGNLSTAANWAVENTIGTHTVASATGTNPMDPYDAISFTNTAVTGNITATVDTPTAMALGIYFNSPANYTLNSSGSGDVLNLTGYGTVGATGDVGYGVNVVPIVSQGTAVNTLSAPIVLATTNTAGLTIDQQNTTNALTVSGSITPNAVPLAVQGAGNTVLSGQIIGTSTLTKTGTGTLSIGSSATNSGVIATVNGGTLALNATGTANAVQAIADVGTGATVQVTGTGTAQLQSTYGSANLVINGGTFDIDGHAVTLTGLAGTGGTVTNSSVTTAALTTGGNNVSASFAGKIQDGSSALGVIKTGTGTQTLTGTDTYTGATTVNAGILAEGSTAALPGTGAVTVAGGASLELNAISSSAVTVASAITISGTGASGTRGAIYIDTGNITTYSFTGGITLAASATFGSYGVSQTANFNSVITGAGGLTFNDEGGSVNSHSFTANFNAANTYSGSTTLASGNGNMATFKLGVTDALPATTVVTMNAGAGNLTLNLNGQTQTIAGLASGGTAAHDTVTGTSSLTLAPSTSYTYAGLITGGLSLTKAGNGTEILTGANTYTGTTSVSAGTLLVNGSLGQTAVGVSSGATLGGSGTLAKAVTDGGILSPGAASATVGTFTLSGGLTLSTNSSLKYDLAAHTASDKIATAALTLNPQVTLSAATTTGFGVGTYSLIDYSSTLTDQSAGFTGWTVTGLPVGDYYAFALGTDAANASKAVNLIVSATPIAVPEPASGLLLLSLTGLTAVRRRR